MEHDFSVCSTGKFPEKVELPVGNFPMELRVPFTGFAKVYQFQAAHDHIFGKEIWRLVPQLARWLPSPPLSTNAQSVVAWLLI